ncbi:helix-turn-helix domain-containing protein [Providencia rettgeri]|uniref:helix-turn-helix domain-containing protein n=1 Tax=Providencia rettgeri TaxID=587 RepID=UPI0032DBE0BD
MKKHEINEGFHVRVMAARHELSLTQAELAKRTGVSQRQIAAYEGHESKPRANVLIKLAESLGTTPEWLATGDGLSGIKNISGFTDKVTKIPIIPIDRVSEWVINMSPIYITDEFHPAKYEVSSLAFAVKIRDPAMEIGANDSISFSSEPIVVFEPLLDAHDQDYVLAFANGEYVFRRLFKGLTTSSLVPNDRRYPSETVSNHDIEDKKIMIFPAIAVEFQLPAFSRTSKMFDIGSFDD